MTLNQTKSLIKGILKENNKNLESNINTKIEEKVSNIESVVTFTPIGTIIAVMGNEAPANYLVCDGAIYNIIDYQNLAEYFETQFGTKNYFGGDGTTTFAVPDLRGEFLRGTGTNSHTNQGNGANVGTHQDATEHPYLWQYKNSSQYGVQFITDTKDNANVPISNVDNVKYGKQATNVNAVWTGEGTNHSQGTYTSKPTNTSVLYCIATKNIYLGTTNNLMSSKNYYSEQEQIIGVWTDGKLIYQKTFTYSSATVNSTPQFYNVANISSYNIDKIIDCFGNMQWGVDGPYYSLPFVMSTNYIISVDAYLDSIEPNLILRTYRSNGTTTIGNITITIQYTKTTDTAGSTIITPGAYDINFPNTWPENQEIFFGNGLYGYKYVIDSIMSFQAGQQTEISIITGLPLTSKIINIGGAAVTTGHHLIEFPWTYTGQYSGIYFNNNETTFTATFYFKNDTNYIQKIESIDVWFTYTK